MHRTWNERNAHTERWVNRRWHYCTDIWHYTPVDQWFSKWTNSPFYDMERREEDRESFRAQRCSIYNHLDHYEDLKW